MSGGARTGESCCTGSSTSTSARRLAHRETPISRRSAMSSWCSSGGGNLCACAHSQGTRCAVSSELTSMSAASSRVSEPTEGNAPPSSSIRVRSSVSAPLRSRLAASCSVRASRACSSPCPLPSASDERPPSCCRSTSVAANRSPMPSMPLSAANSSRRAVASSAALRRP
eukprot:scaffold76019_cov66-Phaeocystis_antarctica.AAC.1